MKGREGMIQQIPHHHKRYVSEEASTFTEQKVSSSSHSHICVLKVIGQVSHPPLTAEHRKGTLDDVNLK